MTNDDVAVTKYSESELIKSFAREICQYFGFHDETIGESFYRALKRGDFRHIQLKSEQSGEGDDDRAL